MWFKYCEEQQNRCTRSRAHSASNSVRQNAKQEEGLILSIKTASTADQYFCLLLLNFYFSYNTLPFLSPSKLSQVPLPTLLKFIDFFINRYMYIYMYMCVCIYMYACIK